MLNLNVFNDFDPNEGCSKFYSDFANNPKWRALEKIYNPIVRELRHVAIAKKGKKLSAHDANEIENLMYDGSDAYDDVDIDMLSDLYRQQIIAVQRILGV